MRRYAFVILFIAGISSITMAQNLGTITVATEEWEDATNADGSGLYFDLLNAVFEPVGGELSIQIVPYTRSVSLVENKRADLMIGAYVDEIEDVIYPSRHFDADRVAALYLKSQTPVFAGQSSLSGKSVAWIRGYGYDEYLDIPVRMIEVDTRDQVIPLLAASRIDFFLDAVYDIESVFNESNADPDDYGISTLMSLKLFMCFADTPKGRNLAQIWDKRFGELLADGTVDALFEEWEFDPYEP